VKTLFVDSGYAGGCAQTVSQLDEVNVHVVRHPANKNVGRWTHPEQPNLLTLQADVGSFVVLPKRWVVERSHACNERARHLVMHHDRLDSVSEAWGLADRRAHTGSALDNTDFVASNRIVLQSHVRVWGVNFLLRRARFFALSLEAPF